MLTTQRSCNILVDILVRSGVSNVIISPGSRNTPLILAFDNYDKIKKHVVIDERTAGFIALGMAQTMQSPVALVCTSGTAVLNYSPAVAEAYYQGVPLIVISADRPSCWIDQDDSQTIRQPGVLDNFVKKSYHIPSAQTNEGDGVWYANRIVNDALMTASSGKPGPVHINVEIDNPLSEKGPNEIRPQRIVTLYERDNILPRNVLKTLVEQSRNKKILILGGFFSPDNTLNRALAKIVSLPNVYVAAETISNIHLRERTWAVDSILSTLSDSEKTALRPDIVITFGGALVSRHIKEFLREFKPDEHWIVGFNHTTVDCFRVLTKRIEISPPLFFKSWGNALTRKACDNHYADLWRSFRQRALESQSLFLEKIPWSDMKAYEIIFNSVRSDVNLQLSNGTTIRYAQLLLPEIPHANFCNRGVSGIDGSVATSIGASLVYTKTTLLITGDISFAYDLGSLSSGLINPKLRIIVISNGGGGIFRFIKSTRSLEVREKYFCASPGLDIGKIAEAFGFDYQSADSEYMLKDALKIFYNKSLKPKILEIKTPPEESGLVLTDFFNRNNYV